MATIVRSIRRRFFRWNSLPSLGGKTEREHKNISKPTKHNINNTGVDGVVDTAEDAGSDEFITGRSEKGKGRPDAPPLLVSRAFSSIVRRRASSISSTVTTASSSSIPSGGGVGVQESSLPRDCPLGKAMAPPLSSRPKSENKPNHEGSTTHLQYFGTALESSQLTTKKVEAMTFTLPLSQQDLDLLKKVARERRERQKAMRKLLFRVKASQ